MHDDFLGLSLVTWPIFFMCNNICECTTCWRIRKSTTTTLLMLGVFVIGDTIECCQPNARVWARARCAWIKLKTHVVSQMWKNKWKLYVNCECWLNTMLWECMCAVTVALYIRFQLGFFSSNWTRTFVKSFQPHTLITLKDEVSLDFL